MQFLREASTPAARVEVFWLCTAPIVPVPIKVPVSAASELGNRYAATRVHHAARRGSRVAARGRRAAWRSARQGAADRLSNGDGVVHSGSGPLWELVEGNFL